MANKMNDSINKRIAQNVRVIREYNGDTRNQLAQKINYSEDTIASYEGERRSITDDYINVIAEHYHIPFMVIKNQVITNELMEALEKSFDYIRMVESYVEAVCLLFDYSATSEYAMRNCHFANAEQIRARLQLFENLESAPPSMPNAARNQFYYAFAQDGIIEGATNTVIMLFYEYFAIDVINKVTVDNIILGNATQGEVYYEFREIMTKWSDARKKFITETKPIFDNCVSALGAIDNQRKLAEYFTALKYFYSMVDSDYDFRLNLELGYVMMKEFSKIGNEMCTHFLKTLFNK